MDSGIVRTGVVENNGKFPCLSPSGADGIERYNPRLETLFLEGFVSIISVKLEALQ